MKPIETPRAKAYALQRLRSGSPAGLKLASAIARSSGGIAREVVAIAREVLLNVASQPRPKAPRNGARAAVGADFLTDASSGERMEVRGYAVVFGSRSSDVRRSDAYLGEVILPSAFSAKLLAEVMITVGHRYEEPLSGDLDLALLPDGVIFRLSNLPNTSQMRRVVEMVAAGELSQCSFTANASGYIGDWRGKDAFLVSHMTRFWEIALTPRGSYERTAAWLSAQPKHLPETVARRTLWDHAAPQVKWIRARRPKC